MRGPLLMLAGIGCFGLLDANNKLLSEAGFGVWQVMLMRFVVILGGFALVRAAWRGWGGTLRTDRPRLHALRAAAMMGSASGFFMAFTHLPLAEGYLVFFTSPFLVLALAAGVLRERPPPAAWGWCAVGFAGVAIGLAPSLGAGQAGALAGYLWAGFGTLCYATVFILNRQLRGEGGFARVLVWPSLLGLALTLPMGVAQWQAPGLLEAAQIVANGVLVGCATVALAAAFRHADAARLAPFGYSGLVWGLSYDLLIWGRMPGAAMLAGAAIVVTACIMSERAAR